LTAGDFALFDVLGFQRRLSGSDAFFDYRASRELARPGGFEPSTVGLEVRCSIQLS
jgi:hypothetical protein